MVKRVPVYRLGSTLAICPPFIDYPRCIECDKRIYSGPERLEEIRRGDAVGICNFCDGSPRRKNRDSDQ